MQNPGLEPLHFPFLENMEILVAKLKVSAPVIASVGNLQLSGGIPTGDL